MKKKAKTKRVLGCLFAVSLIFGLFLVSMVFSKFIVTEEKPPEEVDEQQVFIDSLSGHAQILYEKYHVLPSITLAQAILESDWGNSELAGKARNLFGVKGDYKGKHVTMKTDEFEKGKRKTIRAKFRKYSTFFESMDDHAKLFVNGTSWNKKKYKPVIEADNYKTAAAALQKSGYATDPGYAEKIKDVIETYNLNEYDKINASLKAVDMKGAIKDHAIEDVWSKPSKERHSIKLASAQKFTGQHIKVVSEKQNGESVWYQIQVKDKLIGWVDQTAVQLSEET